MNPYQLIMGNWRVPSTIVAEIDEFIHIGADGRIVHFVHIDATGERAQPMSLWSEPLGGNQFHVRLPPRKVGWTVGLVPSPSGMTIEREEVKFYLRRAADEDLPEWFSTRLEEALARMSTLETRERESRHHLPATDRPRPFS